MEEDAAEKNAAIIHLQSEKGAEANWSNRKYK